MEGEPREVAPPSDERLYLTGQITVEEYNARIEAEAERIAAHDLERRRAERSSQEVGSAAMRRAHQLQRLREDPQIILPRDS